MILKEFTTNNKARLDKITRALSENYNYELDFTGMTQVRAKNLMERAEASIAASSNTNQRVKLGLIAESLELWMQANVQTELTNMVAEGLDDDSVEGAKVVIAAQELCDSIQGMIEDAAKMQVQDLLPIVDAMKSEIGAAEAEAFSSAADEALGGLVDALKSAKEGMDNAISAAQGQEPASDMDDFDMDSDGDMDVDMDLDMDDEDMDVDMEGGDEFGGDAGEIAGEEPSGRELKDDE